AQTVEAYPHAVRAEAGDRLARDDVGPLGQCDGAEAAGIVPDRMRTDHVDAGLLEPQSRPRAEVAAGRVLERSEEIIEDRVRPGVLVEVGAQAGEELLAAHVGH